MWNRFKTNSLTSILLVVVGLPNNNTYTQNGESEVLGASEIHPVNTKQERRTGQVNKGCSFVIVMVILQQISDVQIKENCYRLKVLTI